ncbi:MAG: threonine synthase [Candidatus Roizmanbacteria bacterium]
MSSMQLVCVACKALYSVEEIRYRCECGEILEVQRNDWEEIKKQVTKKVLKDRQGSYEFPYNSGVWRYHELILPVEKKYIVSKPEGNTNLYFVGTESEQGYKKIGEYVGVERLFLKHEGENPTGSFKDRGMTCGMTQAKVIGAKAVACASTGNTSASLASYASQAGIPGFVFIPDGKISMSKLSQTIAYGATTLQVKGDFDVAMKLVQEIAEKMGIYLLNSINPFRIEGQKSITYELLQQLDWEVPDWLVLPGGNLGNTSAAGKALLELKELGFIKKIPRIAVIQAHGANPFFQSYTNGFKDKISVKASTIASAINIGAPVSHTKAVRVIHESNGIVEEVADEELLNAKAIVDRVGIGCEPGSATTVAGIKKLIEKGIIKSNETVAGYLTAHVLKDPDTTNMYHQNMLEGIHPMMRNEIIQVDATLDSVQRIIEKYIK